VSLICSVLRGFVYHSPLAAVGWWWALLKAWRRR
jgi:hypothetical protein